MVRQLVPHPYLLTNSEYKVVIGGCRTLDEVIVATARRKAHTLSAPLSPLANNQRSTRSRRVSRAQFMVRACLPNARLLA